MASKLSRVSLPKLSASQPTIRALSQSTPKSKSHESDTEAIQLQRIQEHLVKFQTHKPKKPRTFRKLPGLGLDLSKLTPAHTGPTPDHSAFNKVKETAALANSRRYQMEEENDLRKRLGRIWQQGDIYAPRDLGPAEQQKWMDRRDVRRKGDVFELIGKNPLLFYRVSRMRLNGIVLIASRISLCWKSLGRRRGASSITK